MPFRIDRSPIQKFDVMPNGSLRVVGTIARVGELKYLQPDGSIRVEELTKDELFNEQWLDSIANSALTLGHPPVPVTPENWKKYAVGAVGGVPIPREDEGLLDFAHIVSDKDAIAAIQSGKANQLSPGYNVGIRKDGNRLFQVDRVGNHSALVGTARGGNSCKLHLDSFRMDGVDDFAVQIIEGFDNGTIDLTREYRFSTDGGSTITMPTAITIGNRTYNVDGDDGPGLADAVASVLDKQSELETNLASAQAGKKTANDRADSLDTQLKEAQGTIKGLETKADESEKARMDDGAIEEAIATRMDMWGLVLPAIRMDSPDFEPDWKLDEMDIKRLWLLRQDESLKDDEDFKSDGFVNGLWRSLQPKAMDGVSHVDGLQALVKLANSGGGSSRSDMGGRANDRAKADRRAARQKRIEENGLSLMGDNN